MILKRRTELFMLGAGFLVIFTGGVLNFFSKDRLREFIRQQFILSETSYIYPYWVKNPMKTIDRFYFFNWTNPSDLRESGYKPKFEEVGPYAFEETLEKADIVWNDNGTVTYRKIRSWFFNQEKSKGSLSDLVTTLNPVAVTATYMSRYWAPITRKSMSIPLTGISGIEVTKTVGGLTFEGFQDPILDAASLLPGIKEMIPQDKGGYFYKMNGSLTSEGIFNVETGVNGLDNLGRIRTWNYQNVTNFYDPPCGQVKGTAGDFWPQKQKFEDIVLFSNEYCRYIVFKYNRTVSVNGIEGHRYEPSRDLFDNGTSNPENQCFCSGECVPFGVLNVSLCRLKSPAFASYPHFYQADSSYRDAIEGMNPDPEKHTIYLVIDPIYGILLDITARMQINLMVQSDPDISIYMDVPKIFFPGLWLEQKATLTPHLTVIIKILLALPSLAYVFSIILIIMGIIFLSLFSVSWIRSKFKTDLSDIRRRYNNKRNLTSSIGKVAKSKQKCEILPMLKENDM